MSLWDMIFGKKEQMQQVPTMSGGQQQLLDQLIGKLSGGQGAGIDYLQNILSGDTSQFEQPLMRQFHQQTIPSLAEMFSGAGAGSQSSSAFGQQLGQAGAGLAENLGALRGNLQMQAASGLSNQMTSALQQRPFENLFRPATQGLMGSLMPGIGSGIGSGIGMGGGMALFQFLSKLMDSQNRSTG